MQMTTLVKRKTNDFLLFQEIGSGVNRCINCSIVVLMQFRAENEVSDRVGNILRMH